MAEPILRTDLPFPVRRGKVRDVYDLGDELLIVATDRISAFDVVMPNGIPDKGRVLTALSLFWFEMFADRMPNHLISADVDDYPETVQPFADLLRGRSMWVKETDVIPIECVARGYITGSGWKEYKHAGTLAGLPLPKDLAQCQRLEAPHFSPATKEQSGHDVNIAFSDVMGMLGEEVAEKLRHDTLELYTQAADYALTRGVIIADTKFEFGKLSDGTVILIDEIFTPDSSRFWPADRYDPGHEQPSFDKQFVRDWLERQPWDKTEPAPMLPADVVAGTRARYVEAYEILTGRKFA